jgi:hypothetical protein
MTGRPPAGSALVWLAVATVLCYGVGYPVALLGHSVAGWVLVFLGGPFLIALGVVTIRRVHRANRPPRSPAGR